MEEKKVYFTVEDEKTFSSEMLRNDSAENPIKHRLHQM